MKIKQYTNKIIKLYTEDFFSCNKIAKLLGCNHTSVWNLLKQTNIKLRKPSRVTKIKYNEYGKSYDFWKIIKYDFSSKKCHFYICICKCGTIKSVSLWSLKNEKSKSCGCKRRYFESITKNISKEKTCHSIQYSVYKSRSKTKGLKFKLSKSDFKNLTKKNCYYCGNKPKKYYNGIDRIDNTKGYILNNIVSCCANCNYAKRNLYQKDFYKLIQKIYNKHLLRRNL